MARQPAHRRSSVFILTNKDLTPEEQRFLRANAESLLLKQQPWQEALIKRLSRVFPWLLRKECDARILVVEDNIINRELLC